MKELKQTTERFLKIQSMYDGGRGYKWSLAFSHMAELARDVAGVWRRAKAEWVRHLALLLYREVCEERDRLEKLWRKELENEVDGGSNDD